MKALQTLVPNSSKVDHLIAFSAFVCHPFLILVAWVSSRVLGIWKLISCCFGGMVSRLQTDKASMLDDAIEYLKQLQLQVQVSNLMMHCYYWVTQHLGYAAELPSTNQHM